jgi:hypothetical protein
MKKPQRPSKTKIKKILSECAFDPRANGPMKVIVEMNDTFYYTGRAQEFISNGTIALANGDIEPAKVAIRNAISLLALALAGDDDL